MILKNILLGVINYIRYNISSSFRNKQNILFEKRENICNMCDFKIENKCDICSCYITLKTKVIYRINKDNISINGCPLKKW